MAHERTTCFICDEPLDAVDMDIPPRAVMRQDGWTLQGMHRYCALRAVVGGLNHQLKRCHCCGGHEPPDPPSLTTREACRVAAIHWLRHNPLPAAADVD